MTEIEKKSNEIESYISTKKALLKGAKISTILIVIGVFFEMYIETLGNRIKFKYTWLEWNSIQLLVFLGLCIPFFVMPLHKFISDRRMNGFIWEMKKSIFETILNKFDTKYQISLKGCLPDSDISFLKLEKGWVSFVYGDDLIFGTINNVRFRLSEMHSNGLIKRHFDGVICVLVFDHLIHPNVLNMHVPEFIEMRHYENKIYLLSKGDKKLFELDFRKNKTNPEKLEQDQQFFLSIIETLNKITLVYGNK